MRELNKLFLERYYGFNIRKVYQVLNSYGGGSVYVGCVSNGREYVIARGNMGGATPATISEPGLVPTMVKCIG